MIILAVVLLAIAAVLLLASDVITPVPPAARRFLGFVFLVAAVLFILQMAGCIVIRP